MKKTPNASRGSFVALTDCVWTVFYGWRTPGYFSTLDCF